jgi:hypothetical protein
MGQPVYERLGYAPHFRLNLYEWRLRSRSPEGEAEVRRC